VTPGKDPRQVLGPDQFTVTGASEIRMNPPLCDIAIASHVEHLPSSAMRVRPRVEEQRNGKTAFPPKLPRALCGPLRFALDEFVPEVATVEAMPIIPSSDVTGTRPDHPSVLDEGFERAQRVASGRPNAADLAWLSKGFSAFLAAGGALPIERCLGLPRNDCALRRACRDYWLRRAWKAVGDDLSPWRRSERLATMVRNFRSRQWGRWRTLEAAPKMASEVELALFQAFNSAERVPETAMQLHNIAHHRRHS